MFRCSECGAVYEVKPDFCDCGNDTFVEEISEDFYQQDDYNEYENSEDYSKVKRKKTFDEQYPMLARFRDSLDPISVIIFILCIISSILVMIFINPKEEPETKPVKPVETVKKEVPDINSFWNDTPSKVEIEIQNEEEEEEQNAAPPVVEQPKPIPINVPPIIKTPVKPVQNTGRTQPVKQSGSNVKPKQNTVTQQPKTPKQTQVQNPQQPAQPTTQQNTQPQNQPQTISQKPSMPADAPLTTLKPIKPSYNETQVLQELKTYKTELRNSLFSKINFSRIFGDGTCTVVFSVDSTGKLINKSFSSQSSNNTLNDEVYAAIMATPYFKKPPSSYKGQKMYFTVKFNGGKYSVSLN